MKKINDLETFVPEIYSLPTNWKILIQSADGAAYMKDGLKVIISGMVYDDQKRWVHVSFSRKSRMPTYEDTQIVKNLFLGNKKAIMVFPEKKNYVNIHKYCLHLYCCLDTDPLPDFTWGMGTI